MTHNVLLINRLNYQDITHLGSKLNNPVTIMAKIKLGTGKTEAELLAASESLHTEFSQHQQSIVRRELVRKADDSYLHIVQFRSEDDYHALSQQTGKQPISADFLSLIGLNTSKGIELELMQSLVSHSPNFVYHWK